MSVTEEHLQEVGAGHPYKPPVPTQPTISSPTREECVLRWWSWAQEQVEVLGDYGANWDGDNAPAPNPDAIGLAIALLANLKAIVGVWEPAVNPIRDGGVSLEWEDGPKYLVIEVEPKGTAVFLYRNPDTNTRRSGQVFEFGEITDKFNWALKLMF